VPDSITAWVLAYLGLGPAAALAAHAYGKIWVRDADTSHTPVFSGEPWWLIAIGLLAITLFGPFIIVYFLFSKEESFQQHPEEWHVCSRSHLKKRTTVEAAELAAQVSDPLHRVPNVPFGHLNSGWQAFLKEGATDYKLWSFKLPRGKGAGYAWVKGRKIMAEFIYEWD
jgi:hypothetical protein